MLPMVAWRVAVSMGGSSSATLAMSLRITLVLYAFLYFVVSML